MSTRSSSASSAAEIEPVAEAGIQAHGFVVAVDHDWRVRHISDNAADFLTGTASPAAGRPLSDLFGSAVVHSLRNQLSLSRDPGRGARLFAVPLAATPKPFDVAMRMVSDLVVIDVLPAAHVEAGDPIGTVRDLIGSLPAQSLSEMMPRACALMRALTGFERVAMFRVDGDLGCYNSRGDTEAPSAPGSTATAIRFIGDSELAPAAIRPAPDSACASASLLRCADAHERDWLGRCGAVACIRLPLATPDGPLGEFVALNASPRQMPMDRIAAVELFADLVAMRMVLLNSRAGR